MTSNDSELPFCFLDLFVGVSSPLAGEEGPTGSLERGGVDRTVLRVTSCSVPIPLLVGADLSSLLRADASGFGVKNDNRVRCLFPEGGAFLTLPVDLKGVFPFLRVLLSGEAFGIIGDYGSCRVVKMNAKL